MSLISFDLAKRRLKDGKVIAVPTETVYGLAGSIYSEKALKNIFRIKKRPFFNPLIVHCSDKKMMQTLCKESSPLLDMMIDDFCPGPITFVLKKTKSIHPLITAGRTKVGLRIPLHPLIRRLIKETGLPLCAPSANFSQKLSPVSARHVQEIFKEKVPVLNGGPCKIGIESTVLEPNFKNKILNILRPGFITQTKLKNWLNKHNLKHWKIYSISNSRLSPGQAQHHYQPAVPLVIFHCPSRNFKNLKLKINQQLSRLFKGPKNFVELKLESSAVLTARRLYSRMHTLSKNPKSVLYTLKTNKNSSPAWQAVWDRLNKASSYKFTLSD